jgi:hypothetical protein
VDQDGFVLVQPKRKRKRIIPNELVGYASAAKKNTKSDVIIGENFYGFNKKDTKKIGITFCNRFA